MTFIVILSAGPLASPPRVFALAATIHRRLRSSLILNQHGRGLQYNDDHRSQRYNFYHGIPYFCPFQRDDEEAGKQENQGE